MRWIIITVVFVVIGLNVNGQTVQSDFLMTSQACLNQRIEINNQSTNAVSYEWDFCSGDLNLTPSGSVLSNSYSGYGSNVDMIEQNGNHFGFFIGRAAGKLYRLDFGTDINSQPVMVDIGNFGTTITNWRSIEIVKEGNNYYGFIVDSNLNSVYRFMFGASLTNTPSSLELIYTGNPLSSPIDIKSVIEGTQRFIFVANLGNDKLVRIKFDQSFSQSIVNTDYVTITGSVLLGGISFIKDGIQWFCMASSVATFQVYKIEFDSGLEDTSPTVTSISVTAPVGLAVVNDNNQYYVFVQSQNSSSSVFRLDFGNSLSNDPTTDDFNNIGITGSNLWGFSMYRSKSRWIALSSESSGSNIFRLQFPNNCTSAIEYSNDVEPHILTLKPGSYFVVLAAFDINGNRAYSGQALTVIDDNAPDIAILQQNICSNNDVNFTSINSSSDITVYNWSFGDTQISSLNDPIHQYITAGEYWVSLQVTAENGCSNYSEKTIKIYDPPVAAFDAPTGLICTNNQFSFTNNTVDNFDGNLSYEWLVNDELKATSRDFKHVFVSTGDQLVKLRTKIPGCFSEQVQTLSNVQSGPVSGFNVAGKCEDEAIEFTNQSAGSVSGYQWDFGNGNTSTQQHPTQTYANFGNYEVSLVTTGTNGCASTITKPIRIYSVPQTNFTIDLPPFACSGSDSQFNDITPTMPDSNVATWAWKFGDASGDTASQRNPLYTYSLPGDYAVELMTTTNTGCSNSIQKTVTIFPSPQADFIFGPACVNLGTSFSDQSTGAIKSWLWSVQGTTYAVRNPIHIFKSAATYSASLTVTGTNNCVNRISKDIAVPVPVVADFTFSSTCATKPAVFDEINAGGADPARAWKWDFAGQGSSDEQRGIYTFPSVGNFAVKMSTTRQSGCTYSIIKTIPIAEPPKAQFTVALEAGAAPFRVDFVNKSSGASTYTWKFGDASNTISTAFSPSFTYDVLGDYTAMLTVENTLKCTDTFNQLIRVVVPQINAAIRGFTMERAPGADGWSPVVTIENKSNVAIINPDVYLDISGNSLISEKIIKVIKPNSQYTHAFTTTLLPRQVDFACAEIKVNADAYSFDNRQCVSLLQEAISLSPYPNPAQNELTLEWISKSTEPMDLVIYNSSGQIVLSKSYTPTLKGLNQVNVDVTGLQAGIYFVSYSTGGKTENFRFSVIR